MSPCLDFSGHNTSEGTHGLHAYAALRGSHYAHAVQVLNKAMDRAEGF
jgi:hypothetical protein